MKDLIDRKALGVGKCSEEVLPQAYCVAWNSLIDIIEKAPAVDAVEVVRCKDCLYNENGCCTHSETYDDTTYRPDYFCADGERRTECLNECM